eukprot:2658249-Amphidinium_carterae.1
MEGSSFQLVQLLADFEPSMKDEGEASDSVIVESEAWKQFAVQFWYDHIIPPKRHKVPVRSAAKQWLMHIDHQLRVATGSGWDQFVVSPAD